MQLHLIAEISGVRIGYDEANHWLYVDWYGAHTQESARAGCLLMLDALRQVPCAKLLNDNSNVTHMRAQLTLWNSWWLEEMRLAGLRYIAWVYPTDFAAREETEAQVQHTQHPVVASFDDVASAYMWLQQQQRTLRA